MVLGGFLKSLAPVVFAAPLAFQTVTLPKRPIKPYGFVYARGPAAVLVSQHFGFMGITTDDGVSFRFQPLPGGLQGATDFTHWAGRFFALSSDSRTLRLESDGWHVASAPHQTLDLSLRGFVPAGKRLYVGSGSGFIRSNDGGATFSPTLAGVRALASDESLVLAAKGNEVYVVDAGDQLTPVSKLPKPVTMLGFAAPDWFATIEDGALYRSGDQGKSWKREAGAPSGVRDVSSQGGTLVANVQGFAWFRAASGKWVKVAKASRVLPGASGFWIMEGGGPILRAQALTGPRTPVTLPDNPMPSVRLLAAHGSSIVVALNYAPELMISRDAGRTWTLACENVSGITGMAAFESAALDGERLQLSARSVFRLRDCRIPGFKTRAVPKLPDETCNRDLCVRFGGQSLLRTRDRGKTWQDLSASVGRGEPIVAAAAAGREILIARGFKSDWHVYEVREYAQVLRSLDDGKTFKPFTLPESITGFAPSDRGWLVGTTLLGLTLVPYASQAAPPNAARVRGP